MYIKDDSFTFRFGLQIITSQLITSTRLLEIESIPKDIFINQYPTTTIECKKLQSKMSDHSEQIS